MDTSETAALTRKALELPRTDREDLVIALLNSLRPSSNLSEAEIDAAWGKEALRRKALSDADPSRLIPGELVSAKVRAMVQAKRNVIKS